MILKFKKKIDRKIIYVYKDMCIYIHKIHACMQAIIYLLGWPSLASWNQSSLWEKVDVVKDNKE